MGNEEQEDAAAASAFFGAGCGCVLAPCHNIQNVSPVANIIALYEEISQIH